MPPGRKPKSREQRIREGNPGNRPLPAEIPLPRDELEKPPGLPPQASDLWDQIVPVLHEAGVLHPIDRAALLEYVYAFQGFCDNVAILEREGHVGLGSMGQVQASFAAGEARQWAALHLRFAEQFGLTPSSRARITTVARIGAALDLEAILDAPAVAITVIDGVLADDADDED